MVSPKAAAQERILTTLKTFGMPIVTESRA
jgi:hypothetical protein